MPMHIQPVIRAWEEAKETNGLIQTLDSSLVDIYVAAELAGTQLKVVPKQTVVLRGTKYTAS